MAKKIEPKISGKKAKWYKPKIKSGRPVPPQLQPVVRGERRATPPPPGKTVLQHMKEHLNKRDNETNKINALRVAESFVKQAVAGSFVHAKEILDRQDGKVAEKGKVGDGTDVKIYVNMPLEGDEAP